MMLQPAALIETAAAAAKASDFFIDVHFVLKMRRSARWHHERTNP
jgi:hypothetical protein